MSCVICLARLCPPLDTRNQVDMFATCEPTSMSLSFLIAICRLLSFFFLFRPLECTWALTVTQRVADAISGDYTNTMSLLDETNVWLPHNRVVHHLVLASLDSRASMHEDLRVLRLVRSRLASYCPFVSLPCVILET